MAQIKLNMSEYELMKKDAILLRESLAKEKDLKKRLKIAKSLISKIQSNRHDDMAKLKAIDLVVSSEISIFGDRGKIFKIKQILKENE